MRKCVAQAIGSGPGNWSKGRDSVSGRDRFQSGARSRIGDLARDVASGSDRDSVAGSLFRVADPRSSLISGMGCGVLILVRRVIGLDRPEGPVWCRDRLGMDSILIDVIGFRAFVAGQARSVLIGASAAFRRFRLSDVFGCAGRVARDFGFEGDRRDRVGARPRAKSPFQSVSDVIASARRVALDLVSVAVGCDRGCVGIPPRSRVRRCQARSYSSVDLHGLSVPVGVRRARFCARSCAGFIACGVLQLGILPRSSSRLEPLKPLESGGGVVLMARYRRRFVGWVSAFWPQIAAAVFSVLWLVSLMVVPSGEPPVVATPLEWSRTIRSGLPDSAGGRCAPRWRTRGPGLIGVVDF